MLLFGWQGISQGKLGKAGDLLRVAGDEFSPGSPGTLCKPYLKPCPQQLTNARRWNYFKPMRTLVVVGGVGGNPSEKKNDIIV